jgi:hypothetical protein
MDARIRVCMATYTKKRTAIRLAKTIKEVLDLDVPVEGGYHGQCDLVINGELLSLLPYLVGGDKTYDVLAQYVLDELTKRALQARPA